jgi:PAS domain S-box-containing protein
VIGVHEFLRERREEILRAWEALVVAEAREVELGGLALRDSIPTFLDALAAWLESGAAPGGADVGIEVLKHVLQRLAAGLDLRQLMREYALLRETILRQVLEAEAIEQARIGAAGDEARRARIVELARLNAGLDLALSDAMVAFVAERDRHLADRRRVEAELRESEERYRRLFDQVPEGIFAADATGRYTDANPAGCALLGMTRAEVLSSTFLDLLSPEEHARLPETIAAMGDGAVHRGEWRFRRKDGSTFVAELDGRRLPDGSFQGILRDVSERRRVEERLAADLAALTRMHALAGRVIRSAGSDPLLQETMDAAVAIMRADKGTLQLLDGDTLRIVAQRGHERPFLDFFAAAEGVASVCGEATRRGERVVVADVEASPVFAGTPSLPVLRAAGVRAVQSTPLVTRDGQLLGILTTHWAAAHTPDEHDLWRLDLLARLAADFIELKRAGEQRLAAAHALETANAELRDADRRKDDFLALLGHELRNPLAPIRNAAYILEHADPGGEQAERARGVLRRQSEHLTRLVDDLLDVTRITRGKIALQRTRVDLRDAVARVAEDVRARLADRGVTFRTALPDAELWADADATRVNQALTNLLHNAAKFTRRGDEVTLSLRAVGDMAEIRVRDTGAGIEPGLLPRVFEPFVQGDRTLARTEGGLGLGLALVKAVVELHGGEVRAESAGVGKGAEFVLRLPLAERAAAGAVRGGRVRARGGGRRVLIVEDNRDAAESLAEILRLNGHEVELAADGPTALESLRARRPDVVLCDIGLPGMDGYALAREMRAAVDGALRLVALSGYAQPEDVRRAAEAGFDAHVAKPPDPEEIARLLA